MLRRRKKWKFWILGISALLLASDAPADTFSFVQGELGATANFELLSGGLLRVTLTNTGGDVLIPSQILTGVFFDLAEAGPLTPGSATLAHGSRVRFGPDGGGNLGGEWAYRSGLFDAPGGAGGGISTVGLGLFGQANFDGPDLNSHPALGGDDYGIVSGADDPLTGNRRLTGGWPLIGNSVVFTLSGLPGNIDLPAALGNVRFQYGSARGLDYAGTRAVPESGSTGGLLVFASALYCFVRCGRLRVHR